ncbi:hsp70-Hsp90 organizing protein 1-like isoform X2 [Cyclopterus lumpus]|uniref:hsp70-Hsp90 organizing protein 1-like isoform X2 n=1 Tax=Cyclopterus lumpus TaxID=8103 RepID=UPI001486DFEF|nr:hsp70-Hsp90 organizing protein 1-like isoform X2 [Cyclopterus lumpus]
MKFTRDICWLLGLGGGGPCEEQMEVQDGAPDLADRRKAQSSSQPAPSGEDEEARTRRRAERRRAKRKRQKERKKLERTEDASVQGEEATGTVSESDSEEEEEEEEDEKEKEKEEDKEEEEEKEEEEWTAVPPRNRCNPESVPVAVTTETKSNGLPPRRTSEEEPVWDVSSAFVANAVSHVKSLKALKTRATHISRENKENEARSGQVESTEEMKRRGESLTVQGIQMFKQGQYSHAVDMFTGAICCDPKDHRFYGNRSCCYWCLERYEPALADAHRSIQLAPDWPKGHFRKGCALMGLKRFSEAEAAMQQVLRLDESCKEASNKLLACRVLQLTELGFEEQQTKALLEKFTTVQAVAASPEAQTLKQDQSGSRRSLWVGNITSEVTEKDVLDLFEMVGEIESVRVLHERFCAFVNFKNANVAAEALERLQGAELGSCRLVMRYPNRLPVTPLPRTDAAGTQQSSAATGSRRCVPINGDQCFYWRTTGCFYGDSCRFKHIPDQRGRDKKPWQP